MSSSQLILPVFSSAIGMTVSFLLLILLRRQKEKDREIQVGMLLGIAVLVFFGALGTTAILHFANVSRASVLWQVSAGALALSAAVLPSLVIWSWQASSVLAWRSRSRKVLLGISWACTSVVLLVAWLKPGPPEVSYLNQVVGLSSLACLTPAVNSILRLPLDRRLHAFLRATCSIYLASACLSFFVPPWGSKPAPLLICLALLRLILLLIGLFGSFILAARFRRADVFLRWSTRLTMAGVLAMTGTLLFFAFVEPPQDRHNPFVLLTFAFFVSALLLFGNWSIARYESWVESHVLGRVDLNNALGCLRSILLTNGDPKILFAETQASLKETLQAEDVRLVDVTVVLSKISIVGFEDGLVTEVPSSLQPLSVADQVEVEVIAPVFVNKEIQHFVCISPGTRRRALLHSEIQFVKEVIQQLGVRLHQIEVETATHRQALRESLLRQQLAEAELRALQAQVNPHFLFNSLNTIADLIVRDPGSAERMTIRLSQVFRYVLARSNRQFVTLAEEFLFLGQYLDIEQERFGHSLRVSLELPPEAGRVCVPSLLLQPLVENAMKHGLAPKGGGKELALRAALNGSRVHLEVCDNGVGFLEVTEFTADSAHQFATRGVGLTNTFARLRTVYGEDAEMRVQSAPMQGCRISISFQGEQEQCNA